MRISVRATILAACLAASSSLHAASWPADPVRLVVPWGAGGAADSLARVFAQQLSEHFHQQFVVENKGGAGGLIGSAMVARSKPDGYTLLVSGLASGVIAPSINPDAGFDPIRDFTHIAYLGGPPIVVVVHPSLNVHSIKEYVALAKNSKEPPPYATPGVGSLPNLLAEYWASQQNIKLQHIPYKGSGPAMADLISGRVKSGWIGIGAAKSLVQAGKLVPLAVSSAKRVQSLPNVPTFNELGYPGMVSISWFSISAPKGVPQDIVQKLNDAIDAAKETPAVRRRLEFEDSELEKMSPEAFTNLVGQELAKWGPVGREVIKH